MAVGISTSVKNSALQGIRALIDSGGNGFPGFIRIYNSPRPSTGAAITTQTLLAEIELKSDSPGSFSDPSNGSMALRVPVSDTSANASGTASWARVVDNNGAFVMDFDVGDLNSSAELKLPSTTITLGGLVNVISGAIAVS